MPITPGVSSYASAANGNNRSKPPRFENNCQRQYQHQNHQKHSFGTPLGKTSFRQEQKNNGTDGEHGGHSQLHNSRRGQHAQSAHSADGTCQNRQQPQQYSPGLIPPMFMVIHIMGRTFNISQLNSQIKGSLTICHGLYSLLI